MRTFMRMKVKIKRKDQKMAVNIYMRPSIKKMGISKAAIKGLSLSQLIEILIYEYSAE